METLPKMNYPMEKFVGFAHSIGRRASGCQTKFWLLIPKTKLYAQLFLQSSTRVFGNLSKIHTVYL